MIIEDNFLMKIKEILGRDDTVLFIGSGLSMWSELPSWARLIDELAHFVEQSGYSAELIRKEVASGDLLQAASYGVDLLTKSEFGSFIRKACHTGRAVPHDIHRKIVKLGPKCFITTNYDHLIEDAFREESNGGELRSITNNHLTETADIVQARATNFIFKPHGDVADTDSIILTREQYASILHGDRKAALEALETLMVSRPIVFIGFGLRDPDFVYVQDLLRTVYKGAACDYYAIMPDVLDQERSFWRRKYGLGILSYKTVERTDGGRDHDALLALINELAPPLSTSSSSTAIVAGNAQRSIEADSAANQMLVLARYARRFTHTTSTPTTIEFPLRVTRVQADGTRPADDHLTHSGPLVQDLLTNTLQSFVLTGPPGAGKTYALKHYCVYLASKLIDSCLSDDTVIPAPPIPIYLDLKLYDGDLWKMAEECLPKSLPLTELCVKERVHFILDSYNEIARTHIESGRFEQDIVSFLQRVGQCRIIIGSRTSEGLQGVEAPIFLLDEIDYQFVINFLRKRGDSINETFQYELLSLLQRPLFFRLYTQEKVAVESNAHPREIYESLFSNLNRAFESKYAFQIDLVSILSPVAYDAIAEGREALESVRLEAQLAILLQQARITICNVRELINWLISQQVLVVAPKGRLSFFHQSITEYLAARELAALYMLDSGVLDSCLSHTRWDQALFLTLGFLPVDKVKEFITQLLSVDARLAIRTAKFVEIDRDYVINQVLEAVLLILSDELKTEWEWQHYLSLCWTLAQLPASPVHESHLRTMLSRGNMLGGAAAHLLVRALGASVKEDLIQELFNHPDDYNYCTDIARALKPIAQNSDMRGILERFKSLSFIEDEKEARGLLSACGDILESLSPGDVANAFLPLQELVNAQVSLLYEWLRESHSQTAVKIMTELLAQGDTRVIIPLNFALIRRNKQGTVKPQFFDENAVSILIDSLALNSTGQWAVKILEHICETRHDLANIVKSATSRTEGVVKLVLTYCYRSLDQSLFWNEMERLAREGIAKSDQEMLELFGHLGIDWIHRTDLLMKVLQLRACPQTLHAQTVLFPNQQGHNRWFPGYREDAHTAIVPSRAFGDCARASSARRADRWWTQDRVFFGNIGPRGRPEGKVEGPWVCGHALRDQGLATAIIATCFDFDIERRQNFTLTLEPLQWWIDFLGEKQAYEGQIYGSDFRSSLGTFIGLYSSTKTRQQLIAAFDQGNSSKKKLLADYVLKSVSELTTDLISVKTIEWLMDDLKQPQTHFKAHLFGYIATETFVQEHLVPLVECDEEPLRSNLRFVLEEAGRRHRRRYMLNA